MITDYGLPSRYRDISPLGTGGIGTVFKATDSQTGKEIALKILKQLDQTLASTIEKEFSILIKLNHPNLIKVYDFGLSGSGHTYFTMDYIKGPNLTEFLSHTDNLHYSDNLLRGILDALEYLTRRNLIHGDIKPENIIISEGTEVHPVLVDFGLSTIATADHTSLFGTPRFLAPEILSSRQYSAKSDLYALGHTFIESITGNTTPIANKLDDEYLSNAHESLADRFAESNIKQPWNLASFITRLSNTSIDVRPDTISQAIQVLVSISKVSASENKAILKSPYIIRDDIDHAVEQFVDDCTSNKRALLLEGPMGSGKRSLMARTVGKAQLQRYKVLNFSEYQPTGFSLLDVLDTLSINMPSESSDAMYKKHRELLNKIKKAEASQDLGNLGVIYSNIVETITQLSEEHPVLIVVPNIESLGLDTLRFIKHLINEIEYLNANIRVLLSHATDFPMSDIAKPQISLLTDNLNALFIRGFNVTELKDFSRELLESDLFSDAELSSILSLTSGIPIYFLDYFNYLILNGIITIKDRAYYVDHKKLSHSYSFSKYDSLAENIVSGLDPNEMFLLRLLSIYTQSLNPIFLKELVSFDPTTAIEKCAERGLIEFHNDSVRYRSPLLKNHLSHSIDVDQLKTLHKTLAEYTILADTDNYATIAHHFIEARVIDPAYEYAIKAYEIHLLEHEYYSAYNLISSLNFLLTDSKRDKKFEALKILSSLEYILGYLDDSLAHYTKLINYSTNESEISAYYNRIGQIELLHNGNIEKAVKHYNTALEIAQRHSLIEIESKTLILLGLALGDVSYLEKASSISKDTYPKIYIRALGKALYFYTFSGSTAKCQDIEKELNNNLTTDDPEILTEIYAAKYVNAFFTGNYAAAEKTVQTLIELAEKSHNEMQRLHHMNALGSIYYSKGQFNKQLEILNYSYNLSQKYQSSTYTINSLSNIVLAHTALSNYTVALNMIVDTKSMIDRFLEIEIPTYYLSVGASIFSIFGQLYKEEYIKYIDLLETVANRSNNKIALGHRNRKIGDTLYSLTKYKDSAKYYTSALRIYQDANAKDDMLESLLKLSLVHWHMDEHGAALKYAKQAAKIFREINCGYLKSLYSYVAALTEYHKGNENLAPMLEAINTSRAFGTREWTWQVQFHLARLYKDAGDLANAVKYCRESINTLKEITEAFDSPEQVSSYLQVPIRKQVFDFIKSLRN